jgi:putative inorganic carbon (HCO3(-)) transporter
MNLSLWTTKIMRGAYYLLFALVPLLLTPWNYELFEYNKMMAVYALTTIIVTSWLVKMIHEKEIRITKTPLDIPIILFVLSQLISSIFSLDHHVSWLGYYSRFNGGMFSIISYVLLYYAFVTNFLASHHAEAGSSNKKKQAILPLLSETISPFLRIALGSATMVAIYGVAERLGIDKHLWVQDVQNRVFSTMGQPNWLAAYLVALSPVAWAFTFSSWKNKKTLQQYLWGTLSVLFFVVLLFTRSRSGLLAFAVSDIIFWFLVWLGNKKKSLTKTPATILHIAFAVIIFFNGSNIAQIDQYLSFGGIQNLLTHKTALPEATPLVPGPTLETGGTESGIIRKYVWQGAIQAWKSSTKAMLIGTGTETFAFAFYQYRPKEHNLTSEWDFLYNKAHNEYLNFLATTGLVGLLTYVSFIVTFVWWILKKRQAEDEVPILSLALFAGWISLLITNFFGFSVVIGQVFLFLFPAMVISQSKSHWSFTKKLIVPMWVIYAVIIAGILILIQIATLWYADTLYARGFREGRSGQIAAANTAMQKAIKLNPSEPLYRDEIANTLAALSVTAYEGQNATLSAQFAQEALTQNDQAVRISPSNVNFWKTRTKIYYSLSAFDPALNAAAIAALEKARDLSPNDPKIYYNLAILEGRGGNNEKAIEMLKTSMDLKPNYRDAYYGLYVFYSEINRPQDARAVLEDYLTRIDSQDKNFQEILQKSTP